MSTIGNRGSLVSVIDFSELMDYSPIPAHPDTTPESIAFRKIAQRAFFETVKEMMDAESKVVVSHNSFEPHIIVGHYKEKKFQLDVPHLKAISSFNVEGWSPHLALVWQDESSNSLIGRKLSPTSFKLIFGAIKRIVKDYPWMGNRFPELRYYGDGSF